VEIPRIKVWVVMLAGLVCFVTSAGLLILIMLIGLLVSQSNLASVAAITLSGSRDNQNVLWSIAAHHGSC
jgi:hypothetical protein